MKHPSFQWFAWRSRFLPLQTRFYRVGLVLVLAGLFLHVGLLLPSSVRAQNLSIEAVLSSRQSLLAGQMAKATVQIPPIVGDRVRQALSKRTGIPAANLKVVEATPKTWTDGCLGLAKANEICTQALVQGWRIVFSKGTQRWIYRTDKQAHSYRAEP